MGDQEETTGVVLEVVQGEAADKPAQAEAQVPKSCSGSLMALCGVVFGGLYVINPGAGFIELIPDNLPLVGNLDEAAATTLLVLGLQYLFGRRR